MIDLKKIYIQYKPYFCVVSLTNSDPVYTLTEASIRLHYWYSPYCNSTPKTPTKYMYGKLVYGSNDDYHFATYDKEGMIETLSLPDIEANSTLHVAFWVDGEPDPEFTVHGQERLKYPNTY